MKWFLLGLILCSTACAQSPAASANLQRAESLWKAGRFEDANEAFKQATAAAPKDPAVKTRWGRLMLERYNAPEAETLFAEALALKKDYAPALLGAALAAAESFDEDATKFAQQALAADPKLLEAQELLGRLALEDNDIPRAIEEAKKAQLISPDSAGATAVLATAAWLKDEQPAKVNAQSYALAGRVFVLNRRYEPAIEFYRKAVELEPKGDHTRSELGITLMRLGRNDDARKELETAYNNGWRDAATVNTLRLMDSYKNFKTISSGNAIVKVHQKEGDLVGPYVEAELKRAIETFNRKYKTTLKQPVQVEVYPDHEDFAVRTLGMPGLGALGVTFGYVVAMDSPSGRKPGSFHWASTLWHELSHVYTLSLTGHRVPRWFTEGMAVYEETAVAPDWGDRLDPTVIDALTKKRLLPIATLDRGFVRPSYPSQVVVSYFQAGQICSYIAEKWNYDKLLDMIHAFGEGKSTSEVIESQLQMKPMEFDAKFMAWLDGKTSKVVADFPEWKGKMRELAEAAKAGKHDEVIAKGPAVRDLYPDFVEPNSAYELVAEAYLAKGDKAAARQELEKYAAEGGRTTETLKKLANLYQEAGDNKSAIRTYQRLMYIYPMEDSVHQKYGDLLLAANSPAKAAMEYQAVVAARPVDPAQSRFNLAKALRAQNRIDDAKEQLLLALEAAPGFKPAQRMLLELSQ